MTPQPAKPTARDILLFLHRVCGWDVNAVNTPPDEPDAWVVQILDQFLEVETIAGESK